MVDSHTRCPEPEVLAAYVDRGLSLAERSRVDHHLASCPQCIALVAGVVRTVADVSEFMPHAEPAVETASRAVTRRTLVGVLAAAAAVIAVLFAPSFVRPWLDRDAGLVSLGGVSEQRSVLGRLTGGFPHAPLGVPSAGGQGGRAAETDRILLTAAKIRESFGERETPSRLHELGLSQLVAGRYDDAAQALLAASREQPANARYLNDVAAVQLERARLGLRPDDLPRALASADRARRLDPSLKEAWFNRALAATALSLHEYAKVAWTDYLERDTLSAWAAEARTRLADLSKPTPASAWAHVEQRLQGSLDVALADEAVRTQTTEARNFIENTLFASWAAAVESGRDGSAELDRIRIMAEAFGRVAGDALYQDAVAAIVRTPDTGALRNLASAHRQYIAAAALHGEDRFSDAAPGLTSARASFIAAGSPFADRAALDLSTIFYVGGKANEALAILDAVSEAAGQSGYAYNAARSTWVKGLIAFSQGRLAETQTLYEQTLAGFERMGDAEQSAFVHNLLANLHFYLGDRSTEWHHRLLALNGLSVTSSHRVRHAILGTTAASLRVDNPDTALAIHNAVLDNAKAWGRHAAISEVLAQRAAVLLQLGRTADADQELRASRSSLANVPDQQFRNRLEVVLLSTESEILQLKSPADSVAAVTRAIGLVEQRRDRLRLAQLNLRLAKSNIVWGNLRAAQVALDRGIQAFEDERATLVDEGRISTLDESWQLFETAVHLAIKNRDYPRAFALSERGRARTLAESRRARPTRSLEGVEAAMQTNEAVIALNQFDDELAVWIVKRSGTTVFTRPLTRANALLLVARQQDEIRHESARPAASAELYNELLRPAARQLEGVSRLVFVPDATFETASFAALWDRSRDEFLVERVELSLAPSVSAFASATPQPVGLNSDPLILGGPNAGADAAAVKVATLYKRPELLIGEMATRSQFMAKAPTRRVVHMSAQVLANNAYPLLSRVLLADDPGMKHSGAVLGREIAAQAMPVTRLVVLDQTSKEGSNRSTSSVELTRAFMSAGVPAVLGTLAGADGPTTRQLIVGFHQQMSKGVPAESALSTLQRNVLQSNGRRLGAWSALVLYGSDR